MVDAAEDIQKKTMCPQEMYKLNSNLGFKQ